MDRLFFKYLAPLLAISIIPTLAIVLILFFFIRNNINELESNLIQQDTETLTRLVSDKNEAIAKTEGMYIEQEIDKIREKLKAMQLDPDFIIMHTENVNAYAENLLAQESSIIELTVINSAGNLIAQKVNSVSLESDEPMNISTADVFHELERKQSYISPPEISGATQLPFVTMGEPLLNNAGSFAGGIIVKLDLGFIRDLISKKKIGESGYLFIVSEKGKLISHPSLREFYQNPDYSKYEFVNEMLLKKNGTVWYEENLISFYTNEYGWTTGVHMPSKEALAAVEGNERTILSFISATLQSIAYSTVLIILFGFLIALAATIFITKRMLTPILNFTNATRRIAQGEFSMKIEKKSDDELGELTDSFNKMAEELKKEREELIKSNEYIKSQAQEVIGKFLGSREISAGVNISELEKPLVRVKNYLAEIKKQKSGVKTDQVSEVIEDVEQIDSFLKDLFEHSRITTDVSYFNPVDFSETCRVAIDKLSEDIQQAGAKVTCSKLPVTKALRASIIQLFENLLSNAIKYKSAHPLEVFISSEDKGNEWQFSVKDNGVGIDSKDISDIFHVRERKEKGLHKFNFGLALCKNIVERHGGGIWAESHKGKGSTFYFTVKKIT